MLIAHNFGNWCTNNGYGFVIYADMYLIYVFGLCFSLYLVSENRPAYYNMYVCYQGC